MGERWNERRSIGGINLRYLAKPSPSSLSRDQQFVNFLNLSTRSPYEVIVYSPWSCTRFEGARLSRNTIDRSTHSSLVGGEEEEEEEEEYKKKNIKRRRCENKKKRMQEETVRTRWFPLPPPSVFVDTHENTQHVSRISCIIGPYHLINMNILPQPMYTQLPYVKTINTELYIYKYTRGR